MSAGKKFREALVANKPLQIVGTINAYTAIMAKKIGHQAIYLSGGGVANASYGFRNRRRCQRHDQPIPSERSQRTFERNNRTLDVEPILRSASPAPKSFEATRRGKTTQEFSPAKQNDQIKVNSIRTEEIIALDYAKVA